MMRYLLLFFALGVFSWSPCAYSQPPSHSNEPDSQVSGSTTYNTKTEKTGPNNSAAAVPQIYTSQSKPESGVGRPYVWKKPTEEWTLSDKIAAGATIAAILQFVALVITIGDGRRTARRQLRAYVSARPTFITSFDVTHFPSASFEIQNTGQSPAYGLIHRSAIGAFPSHLQGGFTFPPLPNNWTAPIVLFPNLPMTGHHGRGVVFTPAEIAGIRNQTMSVYIYGEIRYRDIFRRQCWTTFCSRVAAPQAVITQLANNSRRKFKDVRYVAAPAGNDADHQ